MIMRRYCLLMMTFHHLLSVGSHQEKLQHFLHYKRTPEHQLPTSSGGFQVCLPAMITKPGVYHLTLTPKDEVCRSFLLAPPDHVIVFSILKANVACETGYVSLFDGMRTSRISFPNDDNVWEDFCDFEEMPPTQVMTSTSNVAMLEYFMAGLDDQHLQLEVQFLRNPSPCDMVVVDDAGMLEMENSGRRNCSVLLLNSKVIRVTEMDIGKIKRRYLRQQPVEFLHGKCFNRRDHLEIMGGSDIGEKYMGVFSKLCGRADGGTVVSVPCPYAMVKLISSGSSSNRATIQWRTNEEEEYDASCLGSQMEEPQM